MKAKKDRPIVTLDFDGTCVTHEYPDIGADIGAIPWLKIASEHSYIILLTMRTSGEYLDEAVKWCRDNNIQLWSVNCNPDQVSWTDSKKVYSNIHVCDTNLGIPKTKPKNGRRAYVDWKKAGPMLLEELKVPNSKWPREY